MNTGTHSMMNAACSLSQVSLTVDQHDMHSQCIGYIQLVNVHLQHTAVIVAVQQSVQLALVTL